MSFKVNKVWFIYAVIQIFYMFFALFVYANLSKLGDTFRYLSGPTFGQIDFVYNSTTLMDTIAHGFSLVLGPYLANLPFVFLSVYGVYYAVSRLDVNIRQLTVLLGLLSLPTFSIWTSVASKEAVGVFFMGIITGFLIDYIKNKPIKDGWLIGLAFYLCAIFKPQYLSGIVAVLIYLYLARKFGFRGLGKLAGLGLFFICSFALLYLFRDMINELSFIIPNHFSLEGESTRENTIWVEDYDVFWNAPYGMFISFVGPTIEEAFSKITHLFVWLESFTIIGVFTLASLKLFWIVGRTGKLNIFYLSIFLIATLWILFVHYPFGALNPGSAVRYRANFYVMFVSLFYYLYNEILRTYKMYAKEGKLIQSRN